MGENALTVAIALPFAAALIAPLLTRLLGHRAAYLLALAPLLVFFQASTMLARVSRGETILTSIDWVPSLGVHYATAVDGLSLTFLLLISGIGTLIVIYAGGYLKGHVQQGRFFAFMLLFMGAMLGLVMSDSFLMLFVYWELTSITSFLLIGFDHGREAARRAAFQALVITGGGGLCLLAGLIVLWQITGVTQISALGPLAASITVSPLYLTALLLILGGAFTKSAQFPFHVWLPNAMEAPTPVSAYLHSATMVKAGVYLLMRLNPSLGGTPEWEIILPVFGGATMLIGAVLAARQTDIKLILAYTTVSSLGLLVMLTGLGTPYAIEAAVLYLVAHALFKGAFFMIAGIIDHETGTRDITRLSGLRAAMPVTFAVAVLAALSMGGLPPFFGFLAKEEVYAALQPDGLLPIIALGVAIVGNALMFAVAFAIALKPFLGAAAQTPRAAHEAPFSLLAGPVVLTLTGLVAGVLSAPFHAFVSTPMASAVAGAARSVTISTVPHIGLPLLFSVVTIALGVGFYLQVSRLRAGVARLLARIGWGPDRGFDQAVTGLVTVSLYATRRLQSGRLDTYMTVVFLALAVTLFLPLFLFDEMPQAPVFPSAVPMHEVAIFLIAVIGLFAVILARDRLTAIVSLGIQGFSVAVIFLLYGAPDLSFTQFMIETLAVIVLALVMTRLKLWVSDRRPFLQVLPDAVLAGVCGFGVTLLLLKITQAPFDTTLSTFFGAYSKTIAHGANIVNVIIVDFRGTDTLGEIAVVMIAGLAILSLVRLSLQRNTTIADNDPDAAEERP